MNSLSHQLQRICARSAAFLLAAATASAQFAPALVSEDPSWAHIYPQFGDIDGDGDIDAIASRSGRIRTFINDGSGRFEAGPTLSVGPAIGVFGFEGVTGLCLGDVDGDGDLDVGVSGVTMIDLPSNLWDGVIAILKNDGAGNFSGTSPLALSITTNWNGLTFGDLDSNGQLDLLAHRRFSVDVFPDVVAAVPPSSYSVTTTASRSFDTPLRLADFDGDNDLDVLVTARQGDRLSWHENMGGSGSLGPQQVLSLPPNAISSNVSDLDGDGDVDLAILASSGAYALDGNGSGGFSTPRLLASLPVIPVTTEWVIECGDLDLDGDSDVVFTNSAGVWWTENGGTGNFGPAELLTTGLDRHSRLQLIDLDGDGDLDLFTGSGGADRQALSTSQNLAIPDVGHDCIGAVQVVAPQAAGFSTATGSPSGMPWACGASSTGADFWYSYQVPSGSTAFYVELIGAFDTAVEVFEGTCGGLTLIACDAAGEASEVFVNPATPGQTYLIRVGQTTSTDGYGIVRFLDAGTVAAPCLDNPSFESGDLSGWSAIDLPSPFIPLEVAASGVDPGFGLFPTDTSAGGFAFRTGFDGPGPGTIELSQTISVAPNGTPLTFNYRAGWTILNPTAALDRTFKVVIRDPAAGTVLQSDLILTAAAQTTNFDTGWLLGQVDLSSFIGQDVQLTFEWYVPESNTGPAQFQLDNVRCPDAPSFNIGNAYCYTTWNSSGRAAEIRAEGSSLASDNNLTLFASDLPPNQSGIFFASRTEGFVYLAGNTSNGHVCVGGTIGRFGAVRNAGPAGAYSFTVDLTSIPQGNGQMNAVAGQTWNFQSWFRDQVGAGSNFTNGVSVMLQ